MCLGSASLFLSTPTRSRASTVGFSSRAAVSRHGTSSEFANLPTHEDLLAIEETRVPEEQNSAIRAARIGRETETLEKCACATRVPAILPPAFNFSATVCLLAGTFSLLDRVAWGAAKERDGFYEKIGEYNSEGEGEARAHLVTRKRIKAEKKVLAARRARRESV